LIIMEVIIGVVIFSNKVSISYRSIVISWIVITCVIEIINSS
jgi:hypothetical protein